MSEKLERIIKSYIPMSEASFLLLASLEQPRHGYGIMQYVSQITGGRVNLGAGTVYTLLYKMEQDGLIKVDSEVDRRKIYRVEDIGASVLTAECERIRELSVLAGHVKNIFESSKAEKTVTAL